MSHVPAMAGNLSSGDPHAAVMPSSYGPAQGANPPLSSPEDCSRLQALPLHSTRVLLRADWVLLV